MWSTTIGFNMGRRGPGRWVVAGLTIVMAIGSVASPASARAASAASQATPAASSTPAVVRAPGAVGPSPTDLTGLSGGTILPFSAAGWRYQEVAHGGGSGFEATSFDDSSWPASTGGAFGSGGACPLQATVGQTWHINTDMLLRYRVQVPAGTPAVAVQILIDNNASVYWNGTLIGSPSHENCPSGEGFVFTVSGSTLTAGTNLLAVRAVDTGVESFVDVAVSGLLSAPAPGQVLGPQDVVWGNDPSGRIAEPVNTATGNYVTEVTDLALPSRGPAAAVTRTYNSLDTSSGPFGPGWSSSMAARLTVDGSGNATFVTDGGAQYVFLAGSGGAFTPPIGSTASLHTISGGYEATSRDGLRYRFSTSGQLTSKLDRNGNTISYAYTGSDVTSMTDPVGRTVAFTYDASHRVTSITDPIGRSVGYAYDANGRLATVTDLRGGTTHYTYDAGGRLATIVDQNGHTIVCSASRILDRFGLG